MASQNDYMRLRRDIGADASSLPDADAEALFVEAAEGYTDAASVTAVTRVLALRGLLANSSRLTTYQQNASMERLSDVFTHLEKLLGYWQGQLDGAVKASGGSAARFGRPGRIPSRIKEYPHG